MSTIEEIKSRIDIVDLVSEAGVKLRHTGKNYTGFCPFHDNKRTPAFVVWPESGTWRCFGACNEGGDIFKFVMKKDGVDFREAMQKLAARAGVEIKEYQRESPEQKEAYEHLRKLLEDAVVFYRSHLFNNKPVLDYLHEKRGLTDATIETFGLGYAPHGWDNALKHFTARGYSEQDLIDSGLLTVRESDDGDATRIYDKFRNRIMIPIRDERGRMAGFGARIVDPDDVPKFLNSPETPVFSKGHLLYGLDRARKPIQMGGQAVIVEGYLDVIALHQAGYENVVSPMGTALTETQLRMLKRLTHKIVLALDPDTAGKIAVLRGLETARQSISEKVPVFDEQGERGVDAPELLRFADQLKVEIKVVALPDDLDPDELVQRGKDEWVNLIEKAEPIVLHTIKSVIAKHNIEDPKEKAKVVEELVPFISGVSDPVERDDYRQRLARMLKVDERALVGAPAQGPRARRPRPAPEEQGQAPAESQVAVAVSSIHNAEAHCLGLLFRRPELLYRLDRHLQEGGLSSLLPEDFEYTDHQLLLTLIRQSLEQVESDQHQYVVIHLADSLRGLAQELLAEAEKLDPLEDRLLEDLQRTVQKLRRTRANQELTQTRFLQEESQQNGDPRASFYQQRVLQLVQLIRSIDQANHRLMTRRTS
jgi:DNA primase